MARFPSNTPARAASPEPVQTVIRYFRLGHVSLMNFIAASTGSDEPRVPRPPGIRRISRGGALAKVCVGRMFWPTAPGEAGDFVETGSRVMERRDSETCSVRERTLMQSKGPKASRAWKPGKSTTPKRRGSLVDSNLVRYLAL